MMSEDLLEIIAARLSSFLSETLLPHEEIESEVARHIEKIHPYLFHQNAMDINAVKFYGAKDAYSFKIRVDFLDDEGRIKHIWYDTGSGKVSMTSYLKESRKSVSEAYDGKHLPYRSLFDNEDTQRAYEWIKQTALRKDSILTAIKEGRINSPEDLKAAVRKLSDGISMFDKRDLLAKTDWNDLFDTIKRMQRLGAYHDQTARYTTENYASPLDLVPRDATMRGRIGQPTVSGPYVGVRIYGYGNAKSETISQLDSIASTQGGEVVDDVHDVLNRRLRNPSRIWKFDFKDHLDQFVDSLYSNAGGKKMRTESSSVRESRWEDDQTNVIRERIFQYMRRNRDGDERQTLVQVYKLGRSYDLGFFPDVDEVPAGERSSRGLVVTISVGGGMTGEDMRAELERVMPKIRRFVQRSEGVSESRTLTTESQTHKFSKGKSSLFESKKSKWGKKLVSMNRRKNEKTDVRESTIYSNAEPVEKVKEYLRYYDSSPNLNWTQTNQNLNDLCQGATTLIGIASWLRSWLDEKIETYPQESGKLQFKGIRDTLDNELKEVGMTQIASPANDVATNLMGWAKPPIKQIVQQALLAAPGEARNTARAMLETIAASISNLTTTFNEVYDKLAKAKENDLSTYQAVGAEQCENKLRSYVDVELQIEEKK